MVIGLPVRVIGGGVAGLTVATALAQRGASVTVFEQAPEIGEVGAGLQISPNGMAVIDALGIGPALRGVALQSEAVVLREHRQGREVMRLDLARHYGGGPFLLVHRPRLIAVLEAAARQAGVEIVLNHRAQDHAAPEAGVLIGADGVRSGLRAALNGPAEPFFSGQVAWRAVIHDEAPARAEVYMGPGRHLVTYPLAGGLRNIVAVEERAAWAEESWAQADDPANLRRAFAGFSDAVQLWLSRVHAVHVWGLFRHEVAARWHDEARVLVGDAAHPTLPFLAQGANLALEDAWVLAAALADRPVAEALALYQRGRRARVVRAIAAAEANARNYHLRQPLVRFAAHTALRTAGALAPGLVARRYGWLYDHDATRG